LERWKLQALARLPQTGRSPVRLEMKGQLVDHPDDQAGEVGFPIYMGAVK
jgi:hypothetical protein